MQLDEALSHVQAMRAQVERVERYCCYRSATVSISGSLALAAAIAQPFWLPVPADDVGRYLQWWIAVAVLSVGVIGREMFGRWQRTESALRRRQTVTAVQQFFPCLAAGALLTLIVHLRAPEHAALLPGLWSILFSLGIFASARQLPRGALAVASYYLVAGCVCVASMRGSWAFSPWGMALTFGVGQGLSAAVLLRQKEGEHVAP